MGDCKICDQPTGTKLKHCRKCIDAYDIGQPKALTEAQYWAAMHAAEVVLAALRVKFIAARGKSRLGEFKARVEECMRCGVPFCSTWKGHRHCVKCANRMSGKRSIPSHAVAATGDNNDWT